MTVELVNGINACVYLHGAMTCMYVLGHGEQNPQHSERDLLRQDKGHRERFAVNDTGVGTEAAR